VLMETKIRRGLASGCSSRGHLMGVLSMQGCMYAGGSARHDRWSTRVCQRPAGRISPFLNDVPASRADSQYGSLGGLMIAVKLSSRHAKIVIVNVELAMSPGWTFPFSPGAISFISAAISQASGRLL